MLLLLACASNPESMRASETPLDIVLIEPELTIDEVDSRLENLASIGLPDGNDYREWYKALYDEGAETDCPGTNYNFDGTAITGYDCYTADGWQFVGFSEYEEYSSYWRLHIEGRIVAPDGRAVYGAGSISEEISDIGSRRHFEGSFRVSPGEGWLAATPSTMFDYALEPWVRIDGGYTVQGQSIYFDRYTFELCDQGEGTIRMRDPSGGWWSIEYPDSCEQPSIFFNGDLMGTSGFDPSSFGVQAEAYLQ